MRRSELLFGKLNREWKAKSQKLTVESRQRPKVGKSNDEGSDRSGDEVAAEAEAAFGGAAGPDGAEIDAHWRKNRNVQGSGDVF